MIRALTTIICLSMLLWIVHPVQAYTSQQFEAGRKLLNQIKQKAATRKSVLDRPYVFVRSQTKYSGRLYQDFYTWFDRPLFASRMLWEKGSSDVTIASYRETLKLYQEYGLDGFMTFDWPGKYDRYLKPLYTTARAMDLAPDKFNLMYCISSGRYADIDPPLLEKIVHSPYSFRVHGKSVISSYVMDRLSPAKLKKAIDKLRKRSDGKILFLPQIRFMNFTDAQGHSVHPGQMADIYRHHHALPATMLRRMQAYLRSYLKVCDGLYIGPMVNNPDFTFDTSFYANILYPVFKSVLAEPAYNGKALLAQQMCVGYTSYHGAQNRSRDGTKTLRDCLNLAMRFHPDMLIGTEWDEENEDTSFEPTVAKPMSSQRIIKYYMSRWRHQPPTPDAGDDTDIPNLIISQRRMIPLGHVLDIELLNVPDTAQSHPYTVRLSLLNQDGKVVYQSPVVQYDENTLKGKTFYLPSEDYKNCQALCSRLTVDYRGHHEIFQTGLPFTVLRATTAWDQTYFCTPLRNVIQTQQAQVNIKVADQPVQPGIRAATVTANIQSPDKLAAVEVMQNSHVIFAYDPKNEYLRNDPDRRMIELSWGYINQPSRINIRFDASLKNASSARTFSRPLSTGSPRQALPNVKATASPAFTDHTGSWNKNHYYGYADWYTRYRLISIKKQDLAQAVLTITGKEVNGKNKGKAFSWSVPLKDFGTYNVVSKVFDDGLMFAVQTRYRPKHNTLPVDLNHIHFTHQTMTDSPNAVLALRLVSKNGKIWWSKPFVVNQHPSKATVPVYVYSDTAKKGIRVNVAKNRVPDIQYDFTPRWGNTLHTSAGRGYYGEIGSYIYPAIGFFALGSNSMGQPFRSYKADVFKGADKPAPTWVEYKPGKWALKFDGQHGNFLALPNVVIPQRAGFILSFDIKPNQVKSDQVLFANQWETKDTFILRVKDGKFVIRFYRRTPGDPALPDWSFKDFDTDIPMVAGKWQKVVLIYNESKLTLSANGKTQSFPFKGIGIYLQGSVFGGYGRRTKGGEIPFYDGLLRSLEIRQYADN